MVLRVFAVTVVQRLAMFSIAYWVYLAMGLGEYSLFDMIALQTLIAMSIDSLPLPGEWARLRACLACCIIMFMAQLS